MKLRKGLHPLLTACCCLLLLASCGGGGGPRIDYTDFVIDGFGDSITAGYGDINFPSDHPTGPSGYPFRLEAMLKSGFPNVVVLNRGITGEHVSQGARRIKTVMARDNPFYILILEGTNDIQDEEVTVAYKIIQYLESMVASAKAAGVIPLISTLTPTTGKFLYKMPTIRLLNELIADLARRESIPLVDNYSAFLDSENYSALLIGDGQHPNSAGYDLMAVTWFEVLDEVLQDLDGERQTPFSLSARGSSALRRR